MGMFDYIRVEYPLPVPDMQNRNFQTKSFDCLLDQFVITDKRELFVEAYGREFVKDPSKPLGGYFKVVSSELVLLDDYHGDIFFYDFAVENNADTLLTFRARFTNGKLDSIVEVEE